MPYIKHELYILQPNVYGYKYTIYCFDLNGGAIKFSFKTDEELMKFISSLEPTIHSEF